MKISNIYPKGAVKLCNVKPGTVVRVCKNDISEPDTGIYMVCMNKYAKKLVNLISGDIVSYHTSSRVLRYNDAVMALNGDLFDED